MLLTMEGGLTNLGSFRKELLTSMYQLCLGCKNIKTMSISHLLKADNKINNVVCILTYIK